MSVHSCHEGCPCQSGGQPTPDFLGAPPMLNMMILMEAIASSAMSCGCGTCVTCRAAHGDQEAIAQVMAAIYQLDAEEQGKA